MVVTRQSTVARAQKSSSKLSPQSKKTLKGLRSDIQRRAFNEILAAKAANGGVIRHGVIASIVKKYDDLGFGGQVTVRNIEYRMQLMLKGKVMESERDIPQIIRKVVNGLSTVSTLTNLNEVQVTTNPVPVDVVVANKGGRIKNASAKKRIEKEKLHSALIQVCTKYNTEKEASLEKRLPRQTIDNIISKVELEHGIKDGKINRNTVIHRVRNKNFEGINAATISPLAEIEPLLVEMCLSCARIGYAQSKDELIQLAQETYPWYSL